VISQKGRPEAVFGRLRRSAVWGASIWGTEGPEFKSRQPDKQIETVLETTMTPQRSVARERSLICPDEFL